MQKFKLTPSTDTIVYHHWYDLNTGKRTNGTGSTKSCPGTNFFGGNSVEAANKYFIPLIKKELEQIDKVTQTKKGQVLATKLNIRKGAGTNFEVVGTYSKGDIIEIVEENDGWYRTNKGWVCKDYVRLV
ncbi:SH3 domain-containing protein [Caloramator sp. Dgby_cultured_2]|uniref:SH3 domain-containing protein n=1 Tax=Caloramator sp. Dgby_cultured_2 TaxID=3029174 RepID=UPI00237DF4EA|nr:SH3 domain-containing protein [Caloramator sp. Dgby_cultured_2]WDU82253.1 SH3 domain-containing protein [Caloramator sp. Dgby_cultured_2]